jgi:hypothetical protein
MSFQDKYLKYKNKYLLLKNQIGGDKEGYVCPYCYKKFDEEDYPLFEEHKMEHIINRDEISKPKKTIQIIGEPINNNIQIGGTKRSFVCFFCNDIFNNNEEYNTHIEKEHKNERKFFCDYRNKNCDYEYSMWIYSYEELEKAKVEGTYEKSQENFKKYVDHCIDKHTSFIDEKSSKKKFNCECNPSICNIQIEDIENGDKYDLIFEHIQYHKMKDLKYLICPYCNKIFLEHLNDENFKKHIKEHIINDDIFNTKEKYVKKEICPYCYTKFYDKEYFKYINSEKQQAYLRRSFYNINNCQAHIDNHKRNGDKILTNLLGEQKFVCPFCHNPKKDIVYYDTSKMELFNSHINNHIANNEKLNVIAGNNTEAYICSYCYALFEYENDLNYHKKHLHIKKGDKLLGIENSINIIGTLKDKDKSYNCSICEIVFSEPTSLSIHKETHKDGNRYIHTKKELSGIFQYIRCPFCYNPDVVLDRNSPIEEIDSRKVQINKIDTKHIQDHIAKGDKILNKEEIELYICPYCYGEATTLRTLNYHKNKHIIEGHPVLNIEENIINTDGITINNYTCSTCKQQFSHKLNYISHTEKHIRDNYIESIKHKNNI